MAYDIQTRRPRRSAVRRVWWFSLLLCLPALISLGVLFFLRQIAGGPALLISVLLLFYLAIIASAMVEGLVRPVQTLSNVVSSLREGDYSFRARGAGSLTRWANWPRKSTLSPICCSGSACARSRPPRCWRAFSK